jgi:ubiquinone biosynthesis protein
MRITSIPQLYRNVNRWREILGVLSKYGLAGWLAKFEVPLTGRLFRDAEGGKLALHSREARIRMAIEELGPTFIKLGQILSTRPDQVGAELAMELAKLQTGVAADDPAAVRATIATELGAPVEELFAEFCETPVASASIGQVHRAKLKDGSDVAVKVQHAGIEDRVRVDTEILIGLAGLAENLPDLRSYRPVATAQELQRTIRRELDFGEELRRVKQFGEMFRDDPRVRIPAAYETHSARRVLTMQWLEGAKISDPGIRTRPNINLAQVARNGAEIYVEMIFQHGVYHADPHPGNLVVLPSDVIGLLDFGMVGRLSETLREDLEDMLLALVSQDAGQLTAVVTRVGQVPESFDETQLSTDIADFVDHYGHQGIGQFDLAGALSELMEIVRRYRIILPTPLAMLIKLLVMLEGTAQLLTPDFNLLEVLAPLQQRMMLRRFSPLRQAKKARRIYGDLEQLVEVAPRRLKDLLTQMQSGKFDVHLDHRGLEPSVNRLVYGLITSALIVGSSLMLSADVLPVYGVSAPGAAGFLLAALLASRLWRAIRKSGRLDRRD